MSGFKYELESVLNLRDQEEDIKQKEYAEALESLRLEKQNKEQIKNSLNNSQWDFKNSISKTIDSKKIKLHQNYQALLKQQYNMATKKVKKAKYKTEEQRQELLRAMKNKKTLEVLKEKRLEQYIEEEKKEEQLMIDEIVSFGFQ